MASLGIGARLWLAFILPWRILFDGVLAARLEAAARGSGPALPEPEPESESAPEPEPVRELEATAPEPDATAALQLLAMLQREGRFVDFLQEDVAGFSDADIGAAARVVHEGCRRSLAEHVTLRPVRDEAEGAAIELREGYDAAENRVTGNVTGKPPFSGKLAHPGWRVDSIRLPRLADGHDPTILAPAEIEL